MSVVDDTSVRLRRLADLEEIRTLKALYCRWIDTGYESAGDDATRFAELFAVDGVWAVSAEPVSGREAIRARASSSRRFRLHLVANPIIELDGDRATGVWHALVPSTASDGQAVWLAGTYDDSFVRTDDGWRFARVTFHAAFRTPYEDGWGKTRFV
ncbi:MAG: hypothetical protein JWM06_1872 [Actinomycetia bacterium]|jgi:ketosteroid isomerase-like protein|nr:hypothetical protein [Actinomycetes bacterium]